MFWSSCSVKVRSRLQKMFSRLPSLFTQSPLKCQIRHRYHYLRNRAPVKRSILRHEASAEHATTRSVLKAIHRSTILPMQERLKAMLQLDKMHSYTRGGTGNLKVRCVETGRGSGVVGPWRVSRIVWREAAINGQLSGVRQCEYFK